MIVFGVLINRYSWSALLFLAFTPFAVAQLEEGGEDGMSDHVGADIEEWKYREDVVEIPDYPDKSSLMKIDIDAADSPFEYFIDPKSLSIGADDAIRYTVVIQAPSGYQNVLFEAMRCDSREYKTHAYGTSNKTFYEVHEPQWKRILGRGGTGLDFRRDLVTMYFCSDIRDVLDISTIMQRIEFPSTIPDENRGF